MLIPVPTGVRCTTSATVMKRGRCPSCGCDFVYLMECRGEGEGSSFLYGLSDAANEEAQQEARASAAAALQDRMASALRDDVQCPSCGRVPPAAVFRARMMRLLPLVGVAVVLLVCLAAGQVSSEMTPVAVGIAALLLVVGACFAALYEASRTPPPEPDNIIALSAALSAGRGVRVGVFDAIMTARQTATEVTTPTSPSAPHVAAQPVEARRSPAPADTSTPWADAPAAPRRLSKPLIIAGAVVLLLLAGLIGYGVHARGAAEAAARADAAFRQCESQFADAQVALARLDLPQSLNLYRQAIQRNGVAAERRYHGKTSPEWRAEWEGQYRRQMAESAPRLIDAALAGGARLALTDSALGEFAADAQQRYRATVKERFDALAAEQARTPAGRGEMAALLAQIGDATLEQRWQSMRRQALLDLAARTYVVEFRHLAPSDDGKTLEPLTAAAKYFEPASEQFARQAGRSASSSLSPSSLMEESRERAYATLREAIEKGVRDALEQNAGRAVQLRAADDAELAELGPAAVVKAAVRGRIEVVAAWGFQGFRQRGRDGAGRIQYLDTYRPHELVVITTVATTRGASTWDGPHRARAQADWTEQDENAPKYGRDPKPAPDAQLVSQVKTTLERELAPYKHTAP